MALVAYFMIVLGPFSLLGFATVQSLLRGELDWQHLLIPNGRRLLLLRNSIVLGLVVSCIAMCLGWVGAVILWSWRKKRNQSLIWMVLPLAAVPSNIYALTWMSIATSISRFLGNSATRFLQGWSGALWVEIATFTPLALGFAWIGLRNIDPELIEVGRLSQSDIQTLLRIALPLSAPATLTGAGIIYLFSILDYGVPSLFQVNVYALEVFAEYSATNSPENAFLLAVPLILFAVGVITALLGPLRRLTSRQVLHHAGWTTPPHWPVWSASLGWVVGTLLVIQALLPLISLVFMGGAPQRFVSNIIQSQTDINYSLKLASLAGLFSLPIASGVAQILLNNGRGTKLFWFLVVMPVAMPASLVGVSMIFLFYQPSLQQEALLAWMPVFANMARFMPLAVLILVAQFRRTDSLLFDAAQVYQPSAWRRIFQIGIPLSASGLFAAAGIIFVFTLGELGATLMVIPPGKSTLTIRIYNYLHYGASATVMGLSLVLVISVLLVSGGVAFIAFRWSRIFSKLEAWR